MRKLAGFIALILCLPGTAFSQSTFGVVLGTVRDTSGAVIGGSAVRLTNLGENFSRYGKTDENGDYEFQNVLAGQYSVTVSNPGFRSFSAVNIPLTARQTVRVDAVLQVGEVSQSVEVKSSAGIIPTDTPAVASTLRTDSILNLPVNLRAGGSTSPYLLIGTLPGVQGDNNSSFSIQGGLPSQTESSVDGISTTNPKQNAPNQQMFPSLESIAEIKVQGVGNTAEYGTPGDIATISRSGTNQFHGALFWYLQNKALNARSFGQTSLPDLIGNTIGGTVGGPLVLPKLYDGRNRTFFYFTWESMRFPRQTSIQDTVPTALMRNGDFSQEGVTLMDPFTETPFPDDVIPAGSINPVASAILAYYPQPNVGTGQTLEQANYIDNRKANVSSNQFDVRIDHNFSQKQSIFGRFSFKNNPVFSPNDLLLPSDTSFNNSRQLVLAHTYTITPNLLNEIRGGISYAPSGSTFPFDGRAFTNSLHLDGVPQNLFYNALPDMQFDQVTSFSHERPYYENDWGIQFMDNLTWMHGRHTVKLGTNVRYLRTNFALSFTPGDGYGDYTFDGSFTGNSFADFLLGIPVATGYSRVTQDNDGRAKHYKAYLQDTYHIAPRLTLDYGVRWEFDPAFYDAGFNIANFDPSIPQTGRVIIPSDPRAATYLAPATLLSINACPSDAINGVACTPIVTAKAAGLPEGLRKNYLKEFRPRLGLAYRLNDKTTVRSNFGMFDEILLGRIFYELTGTMTTDVRSFNNVNANGQPIFQFPETRTPGAGVQASDVGTSLFNSATNINYQPPYMMQWGLSVDRRLTNSMALRLSYIADRSVHLNDPIDYNQPQASTTFFVDRPLSDRRFPNWFGLNDDDNGATALYNSFQVELTRHMSRGLTFTTAYTLAKNLADNWSSRGGVFSGEAGGSNLGNSFNRRARYGDVYATRRHRSVSTLVYELPVGKGRKFLPTANRFADAVLGGWALSSIVTLQTGPYLTPIFTGGDPSGTDVPDRGPQTPDRIARGSVSNPNSNMWLDRNAFVCPGRTPGPLQFNCHVGVVPGTDPSPIGRFGNSGVGILTGPGTFDWNQALNKRFKFEKFSLKLEGSFTNMPNWVNLNDPVLNIANSSFGQITSARGGADFGGGRTGQVSLRVEF